MNEEEEAVHGRDEGDQGKDKRTKRVSKDRKIIIF